MGTTIIFSFIHQSCVWPRFDPFFWQNPCSGCKSGIDLVIALKYTFFQLCSNAKQIYDRLVRLRRSSVKRTAVVVTSHTNHKRFCLMCAALFKVAMFLFCSCLSPMIAYLRNLFVEHTSCLNVVNSKLGKQIKIRKDVK